MIDFNELQRMLETINPALLTYEEWVEVGMAIKTEGYDCSIWDEWSKADNRYHRGECERKWDGFDAIAAGGITGATIAKMAYDRGYKKQADYKGEIYSFDKIYYLPLEEYSPIPKPTNFDPCKQLSRYISALFQPEEYVAFNNKAYLKDGAKYVPSGFGSYAMTASEILQKLEKAKSIDSVIGTYEEKAGAWIRINPFDGKGIKDENVTDYRYCLVESDINSLDEQYAKLKAMQLPIKMLVHSGGKSLHAIVNINANNKNLYKARVAKIFNYCSKNGFEIDGNNCNASRLSRMPGVSRNGEWQYIVAENMGKNNYEEWEEWVDSMNDDLPSFGFIDINNLPQRKPELIHGILRKGHKMIISGPSKAGKSFSLIQLACAIASGKEWFGNKCEKGKVLYINFEIDDASFAWRVGDVAKRMNVSAKDIEQNFIPWNLRGYSTNLDNLVAPINNRCKDLGLSAIILDPIYKIQNGDENNAGDISKFCNALDKIANEIDVSLLYVHHHAKGSMDSKSAIDRASGSGVFARDPDAIVDMLEIEPDDVELELPEKATAWKISFTLREFATPDDMFAVFDYPVHYIEPILAGAKAKHSAMPSVNAERANKEKKQIKEDKIARVIDYISQNNLEGIRLKVKDIVTEFDVTNKTVYRWIEQSEHLNKDIDGYLFITY